MYKAQLRSHQELFREQQVVRTSPAWRRISAWQRLPGCTLMLEMLLRRQGCCGGTLDVNSDLHTSLTILAEQLQHRPTLSSCRAQINLVVTVHKLLLSCVTPLAPHAACETEESCFTSQDVMSVHVLLRIALTSLQAPQNLKQRRDSCMSGSSRARADAAPSPALPAGTKKGCGTGSSGSSSCRKSSDSKSSHTPSNAGTLPVSSHSVESVGDLIHQLRAVVMMMLVWLSNVRLRREGEHTRVGNAIIELGHRSEPQWLAWMHDIRVHDTELADVALALTLPLQPGGWKSTVESFKQEAAVWDGYAVKHFHWRLLPSCSYLGCTNMSGISEGTLASRLCSGCRRTRYCSTECQTAAWSIGGHGSVCGSRG